MRDWIRKLLMQFVAVDVYDLHPFYVVNVIIQEFSDDLFIVIAVMADSRPSSGQSRYDDRRYDYDEVVSHAGEAVFDLKRAEQVQRILKNKAEMAHSDL